MKRKKSQAIPFDISQGVEGLIRPEPLPVEETFNEYVKQFGGQLISELLQTDPQRPQNADYYFPSHGVIAELKCFEKDLFNNRDDVERIGRIIKKNHESGLVDGYKGFRWLLGQEPLPSVYRRDMLSLARRYYENAIRKADKQIESTKKLLDLPNARGLVLLANDGNYFSHPEEAVGLIAQVMQQHFMASHLDGFVYFTINSVVKVPGNDRELLFWVPSYRKTGDELGDFVNLLGAGWGSFYAEKIGQDVPSFQTEDTQVTALMRNFR